MKKYLPHAPRPWHVLLSPVVPILLFLRASASGATPHSIVWPLAAMVGIVLAGWIALAAMLRDARKAGLLVTLLTLASSGYFVASDLAHALGQRAVVPILYLAVLLCIGLVWRSGSRVVARVTSGANAVLVIATAVLAGLVVRDELRVSRAASVDARHPLPGTTTRGSRDRPDIYVLVLEGYAREDVLRSYYGFDDGLAGALRSLGFFVADRAAGNYPQMGQSLASALNLEYLPALLGRAVPHVPLRRRLGELITRNRVFAALHAAGYHITSYESEYAFLRPEPVDARPGPLVRFTNFEYRLYGASLFPRLLRAVRLPGGLIPAAVHRHQVRWSLNRLASETAAGDRPTFVFAHLLMPHPPFAVQADGSARATQLEMGFNDGDFWQDLARGTGEHYEPGYLDAVKLLTARVPAVVRQVLNRSTRPTIFYILSDHGPASRLRWERPDPASVRERLGILLAVRFPDGDHSPIHSRTTPVNAFRALLNRALGTGLPMLEDRSYFTTWERMSEYTDVTHQVQ